MRFQKFHNQWEYEWYDFKIWLEGFYLILGMAWFNQVELTRVIQSSMSVWTDKRVYLRCICCWIEDRQPLCLPKRPNGGCGLLWGLCKHPRMLAQRRFAAHATDPSLPHPDIWSVKQRAAGRRDSKDRKNKKKTDWLRGGRVLRRIVRNRWGEGWRRVWDTGGEKRGGWMEDSRYNWMRNMNRGMWKRNQGVVAKQRTDSSPKQEMPHKAKLPNWNLT